MRYFFVLLITLCGISVNSYAQKAQARDYEKNILRKGIRFSLDSTGTRYIALSAMNQLWFRFDEMNPGSMIHNKEVQNQFDISIRRLRFQVYGQLTNRLLFYSQFGINNLNFTSSRKWGDFFHDALIEYAILPDYLHLGGGLNSWGGYSRYSVPSTGTSLAIDVPIFEQATLDMSDQFGRKLGFYAKGNVDRFQYRMMLTKPFVFYKSPFYQSQTELSYYPSFYPGNPKWQGSAYVQWQFWEKEDHTFPFYRGTYLGSKRVLNIGLGGLYQPKAMWYKNGMGDTLFADMGFASLSLYMDLPMRERYNITLYSSGYFHYYGKNFLSHVAPNRISDGLSGSGSAISGHGNAFPMGTGVSWFTQFGFDVGIHKGARLGSSVGAYLASLDRLAQVSDVYEVGMNYYPYGIHALKLGLMLQNRPWFDSGGMKTDLRKNMLVLQFQVSI